MLNGLPWKWTKIILLFFRVHPSTTFQTFVDQEGYSISSKGFLPTVVNIVVIWIKLAPSHPCQCSLLLSPAWPCLIYFDSWTQHSRFLCNIVLCSFRLYFHHQMHPQLIVILLWPNHFILAGAISNCPLLFPNSILDTFRPVGIIFWFHMFLSFHTVLGVLVAIILERFAFPLPVDHVLSELFTVTHPYWVALP